MPARVLWFGLLGSFAFVVAGSVNAQTLDGTVRVAETRAPLRNALIVIIADGSNQLVDSTRVDTAGVFYLNAPKPGTYRVEIRSPPDLNAETFSAPSVVLDSAATAERVYLVPAARLVLYESQVEKPTRPKVQTPPKYPSQLERTRIQGDVVMQFVVTSAGNVDMATVKVLSSPSMDLSEAVRLTLLQSVFYPAQINGQPVSQLAQQKFRFRVPHH